MAAVPVRRSRVRLLPDFTRRITKTYVPGDAIAAPTGGSRVQRVISRTLSLAPDEVRGALKALQDSYADRSPDLEEVLLRGYSAVEQWIPEGATFDADRRLLIGAYFVHEYSLEGAALTNPSIVAAPDQTGVAAGSLGVIVSLRAVGEGHISSVEFRSGTVGPTGEVSVAEAVPPVPGTRRTPLFDRRVFEGKLAEMRTDSDIVHQVLGGLNERFTMESLESALAAIDGAWASTQSVQQMIHAVHWLASSNYAVDFDPSTDLSQRVLTPNGPAESHGLEDARFVRFVDDDGSVVYYGTYTAFDGFSILPQLIETVDFLTFRVATLNGPMAVNKGMALFPRRVGGRYAALGRIDGESNYLLVSDHVRFWHEADVIQTPTLPWELLQLGNAGSPVETEAGWLVVTHGVGPMRTYALGAILLDLEEPRHVIGRLDDPLLTADGDEALGYVPNVVYSCGSLVHDGELVIAYGASDTFTSFASVALDDLLSAMTRH